MPSPPVGPVPTTGNGADALPERARAWAESLAAQAVVDATPVGGGITGTKWILRLAAGDPLVIRWSDPVVWGDTGREHVRREAMACRLLESSTLPVPRLVGSDPEGAVAGGPANLMTWRPGRVRHERLDRPAIDALARLAVAVHRQPVPEEDQPPAFGFRVPTPLEVPGWAGRPGLWRRAIGLWAAGSPRTANGLLHRDFHFGNLLWQGDTVTGLIDWAETSWGPPDLDVAHACSDFAMLHTTADAETFRSAYVAQGGQLDADPDAARFWAVSDILGFLPDPAHILPALRSTRPDLTADAIRRGLEDLLAATLR